VRGLFVTGTDTGVGKTVLAGAVAAALARRGTRVAVFKPVLTGLDEPADPAWPRDDELLGAAAGVDPARVTTRRYGPAVSPHLAAQLAGEALDPQALVSAARRAAEGADAIVVEGVGGLLVPLAPGQLVRDLAAALELPLLVAARPGLGTINHTLLTLEAARAAGLRVAAVVLTPWPSVPTTMETSNRETIEALGRVAVATLPAAASAVPDDLADAAAGLPLADWLAFAPGTWRRP
jgi:dethiobiotin synthetase